jgi:hypothetical protein
VNKELLYANGYTKEMVDKIPSLFNKDGISKLLNYLHKKGVLSVNIVQKKKKNYFWFTLA